MKIKTRKLDIVNVYREGYTGLTNQLKIAAILGEVIEVTKEQRQIGKTQSLIDLSLDTGIPILVRNKVKGDILREDIQK